MAVIHRLQGFLSSVRLGLPRVAQSNIAIPDEYRDNFRLLYADIGWFGLLNGTTLAFMTIYAARLGASTDQMGWINAAPAFVILLLSLPAGLWLEKRSIQKSVFRSAFLTRIFYLLMVPLPLLFNNAQQIWALIAFTFFMNIPGAVLNLGFNALFAETVPPEWRGHVVGLRNAIYAVTSVISTLISGFILKALAFPFGYQIVFFLGFIGAAMSTLNLYRLRPVSIENDLPAFDLTDRPADSVMHIKRVRPWSRMISLITDRLQVGILKGPYGKILLLLGLFHVAWYLPIPLFPVYYVNVMNLSDQTVSIGTALYNAALFVGSTQLAMLSRRIGHHKATAIGFMMFAAFPLILAISTHASAYLIAMLISGAAWSIGGGALYNYLLEKVPPESRPTYLAWFSMLTNGAILAGSLLGPVVAGWIPLATALLIFALLRFLTGFAILRWG